MKEAMCFLQRAYNYSRQQNDPIYRPVHTGHLMCIESMFQSVSITCALQNKKNQTRLNADQANSHLEVD